MNIEEITKYITTQNITYLAIIGQFLIALKLPQIALICWLISNGYFIYYHHFRYEKEQRDMFIWFEVFTIIGLVNYW